MEKEIEGLPEAVRELHMDLKNMDALRLSQLLYSILHSSTGAKASKIKVIRNYLDQALLKEYGI